MSNYDKIKRKIKRLSNDKKLNNQIIRKIKGSYYLYNTYKITNINGSWEVQKRRDFIHGFEASSTATSWCLADRCMCIESANNFILLDKKIQRLKVDAKLRSTLIKEIIDPEKKTTVIARLTQDLYICNCLRVEIADNFSILLNTHNLQDFKI